MEQPVKKPIVSIIGTEEERRALQKLKEAKADGYRLSYSDFILKALGIR